ncbi:MAG: serine hydrolase [Eubacteriales bacterium]|nr:serine hydrolase [Eubacteriales bacterium]
MTTKKPGYRPTSAGTPTRKLSPKARQARLRRMRRRKIKHTILLMLLIVILGAAGYGAIYLLRGGDFENVPQTYALNKEFQNTMSRKENMKADTFAENLCVVTGNVPLETSSLTNEQKGMLLNLDEKEVMYSQNVFDRVYPASITKIMTAMLAFKYADMNDVVTISQEDVTLEEGSQVVGFWAGDQVTMEKLVHCLLVYSGNDAAMAIAEHIGGGSIDQFVVMMNNYAQELGCTGTHFMNPHGLTNEQHYTTPYDIYLMLKEALNYPEFTQITQLPSYTVTYNHADGSEGSTTLEATDHYLTGEATAPKDVTVLGGKTGYTSEAGNCLALLSQNAYGKPYVSIVMGASTKDVLYEQMNSLLQNIN